MPSIYSTPRPESVKIIQGWHTLAAVFSKLKPNLCCLLFWSSDTGKISLKLDKNNKQSTGLDFSDDPAVVSFTISPSPQQGVSQTHILSHASGHRLLIGSVTVSPRPPHSVTQELLMACVQQQPVSAALHTALIKRRALWGLRDGEKASGVSYCNLKHQYNNHPPRSPPPQTQRGFTFTHLAFNPPWEVHQGRVKYERQGWRDSCDKGAGWRHLPLIPRLQGREENVNW